MQRGERHSGRFTLIELLVVVVIIMILAAILLPALQRARQTALTVGCISSYRQIGMLIHQFADDFNGRHPGNAQRFTPSHATQQPFAVFAYGYVKDTMGYTALKASGAPGELNCTVIGHHATEKNDDGYSLTNYGLNMHLTGYHWKPYNNWISPDRVTADPGDHPEAYPYPTYGYYLGARLSLVKNPDIFIDAADYTNLNSSYKSPYGFLTGDPDIYGAVQTKYNKYDECLQMTGNGVTFRHVKRGTILYLDAHVAAEPILDDLNDYDRWRFPFSF